MAASLCFHAYSQPIFPKTKPYSLSKNHNCSVSIRRFPRSSSHQDSDVATSVEDSSPQDHRGNQNLNQVVSPKREEVHDSIPPSRSCHYFSNLTGRLRNGLGFDELGKEILSIALPAALALAADPITSLVDTAFIGHLGSVELAAVGLSISSFNLVSKLVNVPLLNITTSIVAEEQALSPEGIAGFGQIVDGDKVDKQGKKVLPSVSTSLALAAVVGIAEAVALSFGSGFLMNIMGIPADSPMRVPAEQFLTLKALGAPSIVIALAAQGAFRGFKDTKTPLYAIGSGNLLNIILDPILIFLFGFGVAGAAAATVISEYLVAFILLWKLNGHVALFSPEIEMTKVVQYLKSGGLLVGRTVAILVPMTLATSLAANKGPVPMAGYQICLEVWLAISLLTDALAIAGQTLLATSYSQQDYKEARQVIFRVLEIGLVTGTGLATLLFLGYGSLASLFTTDSEVLNIAWSGTLFVAGSQPVNAIAFVVDGLYYGVSDFGYAAYSMVLAGGISSLFLIGIAPSIGLSGIYMGLFLFMALRLAAGAWRLTSRSGPWKTIYSELCDAE